MARLELRLLGGLEATLDGAPVTAFESVKVRALLAYLVAEADRPQRREALAGLLWPDWPQQSAIRNLRNTLVHLRQNIGDREALICFRSHESPLSYLSRKGKRRNHTTL